MLMMIICGDCTLLLADLHIKLLLGIVFVNCNLIKAEYNMYRHEMKLVACCSHHC